SASEIARHLKIEGSWKIPDINTDLLVMAFVFIGGLVLLWQCFSTKFEEKVYHQ
nr:6K2 [Dendrobium chlorotic mosaic virus]